MHQQPGLAQRLPETDGAKHPIRWAFISQALIRWRHLAHITHPIKHACYSFIDLGRMKSCVGIVGLVGWPVADGLPT